jgi:hypothetical protein
VAGLFRGDFGNLITKSNILRIPLWQVLQEHVHISISRSVKMKVNIAFAIGNIMAKTHLTGLSDILRKMKNNCSMFFENWFMFFV